MKFAELTRAAQPPDDSDTLHGTRGGVLVKIYPVQVLEPPLELTSPRMIVGRDEPSDLRIGDDSVSRRHALLEIDDSGCCVIDLGSTNGTYVNEQPISSQTLLRTGDRLRFGNHIFKYLSAAGIEAQYHEAIFGLLTTDGLTSVHNKRYFLDALRREMAQSARAGTPVALLMIDLDKFKSINDTLGHLAGDAVLVEFARRASSKLRGGELLARFGGEEFALLMSRAALQDAIQVAEAILRLTADAPIRFDAFDIPLTVSIGVACTNGLPDCSPESLLAEADQFLYMAKNSGRNRVCFSTRGDS